MSLTSIPEVEAYLKRKDIPFTAVTELAGGAANWTYRVTQPSGPGLILKHTNIYCKDFPDIKVPAERATHEAHRLKVIPPLLPQDAMINVHPPELLHFDEESFVQHQRPSGARTLKAAYTDATLDITAIGNRMGRWVAGLHALPPVQVGDDTLSRQIVGGSYRNCPGVLEKAGIDAAAARAAHEKYSPLFQSEDMNLCHGDFWTGNVLLPEIGEANPHLTMLDWEMSRRGNGATDVGQFAAESWLLDRWKGGRGLLPAFLAGYRSAAGSLSGEFIKRAAVHCGVHLAYWPSMVEWADAAGTHEILAFGADMIAGAEDPAWLKQSVFAPLCQ